MNAKAKGSKNERLVMEIMESDGYLCTKSGASLGVFDLVCVGPKNTVCIQVKSNRWAGKKETAAIERAAEKINAVCEIWRIDDGRGRTPKTLQRKQYIKKNKQKSKATLGWIKKKSGVVGTYLGIDYYMLKDEWLEIKNDRALKNNRS